MDTTGFLLYIVLRTQDKPPMHKSLPITQWYVLKSKNACFHFLSQPHIELT